jgi:hypothetical protein
MSSFLHILECIYPKIVSPVLPIGVHSAAFISERKSCFLKVLLVQSVDTYQEVVKTWFLKTICWIQVWLIMQQAVE